MVVWRIAGRLQAFDGAAATIELKWRRDVDAMGVEPSADFEQTLIWNAQEGSTRVLDLVRQAGSTCDAEVLEMRYILSGPDDLAQAAIGYDVWLVQPLPAGGRQVLRLSPSAEQGGSAPFAFPTLTVQERQPKPGASPMSLSLRVQGSVTGRVRPDGRIDLAVDAGRMVGRMPGLSSGSFGRTRLIVTPGETVELQPPPLNGTDDGQYEPVLRDARTAIRVRAKRLW